MTVLELEAYAKDGTLPQWFTDAVGARQCSAAIGQKLRTLFSGRYPIMADPRHLGILRASIENWNLMRRQEPDVKPDLREANLSQADLSRADLRQADLVQANLSWADLSEADLSEANLSGANLSWARLREANLSGADLHEANLHEANLRQVDLSQADLREADLLWSTGLTREQIDKAKTDQTTKLPYYLRGSEQV